MVIIWAPMVIRSKIPFAGIEVYDGRQKVVFSRIMRVLEGL